jgi:nucleotide-binding universal stress UspA family protein
MIPKYTRVLVVTDFSSTGDNAIGHAFAIVEPGGQVHMLHVIKHSDAPSPLYAHYVVDDASSLEKRKKATKGAEDHLRSLVPLEAQAKGVEAIVAAVVAPEVAICAVKEAVARKVDAIVLGAHVRRGFANFLKHSVAIDILSDCDLPVLLVRKV